MEINKAGKSLLETSALDWITLICSKALHIFPAPQLKRADKASRRKSLFTADYKDHSVSVSVSTPQQIKRAIRYSLTMNGRDPEGILLWGADVKGSYSEGSWFRSTETAVILFNTYFFNHLNMNHLEMMKVVERQNLGEVICGAEDESSSLKKLNIWTCFLSWCQELRFHYRYA